MYKKARKCADLELLRTTYPKDDDDAGILYAAFFRLLTWLLPKVKAVYFLRDKFENDELQSDDRFV